MTIQNMVIFFLALSSFTLSFKTSVKLSFFNIPTKIWQQLGFAVLRTGSIRLVGKVLLPPYTPHLHLLPNTQHLKLLW